MRNILFRAKRTDNGDWIEGYVMMHYNRPFIYTGEIENKEESYIGHGLYESTDDPVCYEVDPYTVGEWTGLYDKNGKKIFEGDVVRFKRTDALGWTRERTGKVLCYNKLPIFYILSTTGDAWDLYICEDIEVIGNIYDNSDLMER